MVTVAFRDVVTTDQLARKQKNILIYELSVSHKQMYTFVSVFVQHDKNHIECVLEITY